MDETKLQELVEALTAFKTEVSGIEAEAVQAVIGIVSAKI